MIAFIMTLSRKLAAVFRFMAEVIDDVRANRRVIEKQYGPIGE
jgi:hypothetical protein